MSVGGRAVVASLRQRVLERLGAEQEWIAGDEDDEVVRWTAGLATTFFEVSDGPDGVPGLGVLQVYTRVATVGDMERGLDRCVALNVEATMLRWQVTRGSYDGQDGQMLWLACSFVVGRRSQWGLESFIVWCVQEQVALATAKMAGDLPWQVGGRPCIDSVHKTAPYRVAEDWNAAVHEYPSALALARNGPADALASHLRDSFRILREDMLRQAAGTWYSDDPDSPLPSWEVPATWQRPGGDYIRWQLRDSGGTPTAKVDTALTKWGDAGNGLLLAMHVPSYQVRSNAAINQLNCLNESAQGATHWTGAWTRHEGELAYLVFLPAALLELDVAWEFVMREILLTFARQAQLARRAVFNERISVQPDGRLLGQVGFEATRAPHGLAWGETGEGEDPASEFLDRIYERLVGEDGQWARRTEAGFAWLPHRQAQVITAGDSGTLAVPADADAVLQVRVRTNVRVNVRRTDTTLVTIAKQNATLSDSVLVLDDEGRLVLSCQLALTRPLADDQVDWVQDLAIRQFITARRLADELAELGEEAVGHPLAATPRPEPDVWFEQYAERVRNIHKECGDDWAQVRPLVALEALTGQFPLPYRMTATVGGGLDYSWRPEQVPAQLPASPEVRVTVTPGAGAADPAWVIRSQLRIIGSEVARARWCNDRNAELVGGAHAVGVPIMIGGWGLSSDGECCLTMGLGRLVVRDDEAAATWKLGCMLGEAQGAVIQALHAAPETVRAVPLSAVELAFGLDMVHTTVSRIVGSKSDLDWATVPGAAGVVVLYGGAMTEVPIVGGGKEFDLVYGELLAAIFTDTAWPWPRREFPANYPPASPEADGNHSLSSAPSSAPPRAISLQSLQQKLDEWKPEAVAALGPKAKVVEGETVEGTDGVVVRFMLTSQIKDRYVVSCSADEALAAVERFNAEVNRLKLAPGGTLNDTWR